ncbi:hypothetical protein K402DRAFT_396293 [Aulographum hederae CBS 113979]|uniref:Acetyl-coenzyme A transporter 1 n=1 Tax=Aulographum hederae CBS 113979 TaxID=1176131 RepID=A0A6G1GST5_9PEZI|nr:hypothetical protein K402DRAFT_396293 [Aulographum hederae CBS 113979]
MPTPLTSGRSFKFPSLEPPCNFVPTPIDTNIVPVHAAQHRQNLAQHNRHDTESTVELDDLTLLDPKPVDDEDEHLLDETTPTLPKTHKYLPSSSVQELLDDSDSSQMSRKSKSRSPNPKPSSEAGRAANGHTTGAMPSLVEHRRKHASLDSPTSATATAHLMNQSSFTLDDAVPELSEDSQGKSKGFTELPEKDRRNFLLLVLLYFLQGVPMGLAGGAVPFLLKSHVSYAQMGVFSLASYPYSLKLLWSPIVDAVWSPKLGRRKSWILPIQTLSGFGMLWLGGQAEGMMEAAGAGGGEGIWGFTAWWFMLVFMCATQDIAVDGWALTLLSPENLSYASTAQTVGLTAGQFLSSTVFLALSSKDFANRWFRTQPGETGLVTLGGALITAGWIYLVVTVGLALMKKEDATRDNEGVWEVYKVMGGILQLKNIQTIIIVHLIAKIGFQANDAVTNLKLLDKGFSQEDLALTVLIDFPFEISLGYYVGKWSSTYGAMNLWCWAFVGRLLAAAFAQVVVMGFPAGGTTTGYLIVVIIEHVFSTFMSTVMFVAISAFHAKIADPTIGGTYMTLLATVSNLGGTFPRFFVLKFVDMFTVATCTPPNTTPAVDTLKGPLITAAFSCVAEAEKKRCLEGGGSCKINTDGYYIVNVLCIIIGVVTFWGYIKPAVLRVQSLPMRAWRIAG